MRASEATLPSLSPALTVWRKAVTGVAVTNMWQSGLDYAVLVKQKIICIPPSRLLWSWTLIWHICKGMNDSYTHATPGSVWSIPGLFSSLTVKSHVIQSLARSLWLRGKEYPLRYQDETGNFVYSCKACSRHRDRNKDVITLSSLTVPMASAPNVTICLQTIRCRTVCHKDWLLR